MSDEGAVQGGQEGAAAGAAGGSAPPEAGSGQGGAAPTDWRTHVPEDLRDDPSIQGVKAQSPEEAIGVLAKGYAHAQRAIGADKVAIPGKDAPADMWDSLYNRLGRPETVEGYKVPQLGDDMAKFQPDETILKGFSQAAHKLGLTQGQFAGVLDWYTQFSQERTADADKAFGQFREQSEAALRKEWGAAFAERVGHAKVAAKELGGDELVQVLEDTGLGNHPAVIKAMAAAGRLMAEDKLAGSTLRTFQRTPQEAKRELDNLQFDKEFQTALLDNQHQGHKAAVERQSQLYQEAFPDDEEARRSRELMDVRV